MLHAKRRRKTSAPFNSDSDSDSQGAGMTKMKKRRCKQLESDEELR